MYRNILHWSRTLFLRRKTDVAIFMNEINKFHIEEHPVQRLWMTGTGHAQQKAVLIR